MHAIIFVLYREVYDYATPTVARGVVTRHRKLVAAIRAKDSELARRCVSEHIKAVRTKVLKEYGHAHEEMSQSKEASRPLK
jgi:DNA-binding FadR family transcriptional regulator